MQPGPMLAALVVGAVWSGAVLAQKAPASPPPATVEQAPERTTATFGDWVMRCARDGEGAAARRVCEAGQTIAVQQHPNAPIAQVALGRMKKTDPVRLTVVLPPSVLIPVEPRVAVDEKDPAPIVLAWQRCVPQGCFASADLKDETVARLRSRAEPGRIAFKDAANRDIVIPLSFRGLAQALDALPRD